jgi:hypothetical protein
MRQTCFLGNKKDSHIDLSLQRRKRYSIHQIHPASKIVLSMKQEHQ